MKETMRAISIVLVIFLVSRCDDRKNCHKTIAIVNRTDRDIYVQGQRAYPDTLSMVHTTSPVSNAYYFKVAAHETSDRPLANRDCWESDFGTALLPSDTLMIFIFDADVVENTSWESVTNDYMVLKRYDLSLEDLERMDWMISYL